ncbi:MAG: hypothetical protein AAGK14_09160 [Verrucomicrobiota bacterium]
MKRFSLFLVSASLAVAPAGAQDSPSPDPFANPQIREIQQRLNQGVDGDAQAVKDLVADLQKMIKADPNNHLLVAYLGSAYTLRSRDAWIADKMKYLKKAEYTMNEAVAADPGNAAVRFVRATTMYHLPAFFGMKDEARSDFKQLLGQIEGADPPAFNLKTQQAVYYYAGLSFYQTDKRDEARAAWKKGISLDGQSELGAAMQKRLERLGG